MTDRGSYAVHLNPIWRDRSNFIINAAIPEQAGTDAYEQLYVNRMGVESFEICCIPFFLHDVALGDIVSTASRGGRNYVLDEVISPSGRYVFRVWFGETSDSRSSVTAELTSRGCLLEWSSHNLLAVDVADLSQAQLVAEFLASNERNGRLTYETGRT